MDLDAIKTGLYTWMQRETGLVVIFARQGAPRPKLPYGEINFVNPAVRVGAIDELRVDGETFTQTGLRTALVSLNIYGEGANSKMSKLRDSLDRPDVVEEFDTLGIAQTDENGPNDLTALEDTKYPERSQMDLTIMYAINRETAVAPVESVEVQGEGFDGGGHTIIVEE